MINPGSLVEYVQEKKLMAAVCLRLDKPGRVFVRNLKGREEKLAESKALFIVANFISPDASYDDITGALGKAVSIRTEMADRVNVAELWELLQSDEPEKVWTLAELADLSLGENTSVAQSAMYRALDADRIYFLRKGDSYVGRTPEHVHELCQSLTAQATNKAEREAVLAWLTHLWSYPVAAGELTYPEGLEEAGQRALAHFQDVALYGTDSRRLKEVQGLLNDMGITRKDAPFQMLVKAGIWNENENLLLHRLGVAIDFSPEVINEAENLPEKVAFSEEVERRDLRHLEAFTIDDESTTDIDDALSFEELEDGQMRVGIHIADASHYIEPDSLLDKEAFSRATAIYLPDLKVRMLPGVLSDGAFSLQAGRDRAAFSFVAVYDRDFQMISSEMFTSVVNVSERLTYSSANKYLAEGRWQRFLALAQALKDHRKADGAVTVPFPRVNVNVDSQGQVIIEREDANSSAQLIVSEMMILANRIAGDYLAAHNVPAIFRSQEPPEKPIEDMAFFDPVKAYACRRYLRKGTVGLQPARHTGLGLDAYIQVTSPIRRYNDLLMQRQLKAVLRGQEPCYNAEQLQSLLESTKACMQAADSLEKDRRNYWILRSLEDRLWQEVEAIVVANHPDKHIVQLCDCLWETECPHVPGHPMPPGTKLHVRIDVVWPRDGIVRVSPIAETAQVAE